MTFGSLRPDSAITIALWLAAGTRRGIAGTRGPAAGARELGHRHQLDRVDAERGQAREVRHDTRERALVRERPDVQLVEDEVLERRRLVAAVGPGDRARVHHAADRAQALRLPAG